MPTHYLTHSWQTCIYGASPNILFTQFSIILIVLKQTISTEMVLTYRFDFGFDHVDPVQYTHGPAHVQSLRSGFSTSNVNMSSRPTLPGGADEAYPGLVWRSIEQDMGSFDE